MVAREEYHSPTATDWRPIDSGPNRARQLAVRGSWPPFAAPTAPGTEAHSALSLGVMGKQFAYRRDS